jgi:hypothetical protein
VQYIVDYAVGEEQLCQVAWFIVDNGGVIPLETCAVPLSFALPRETMEPSVDAMLYHATRTYCPYSGQPFMSPLTASLMPRPWTAIVTAGRHVWHVAGCIVAPWTWAQEAADLAVPTPAFAPHGWRFVPEARRLESFRARLPAPDPAPSSNRRRARPWRAGGKWRRAHPR